VAAQGVFQRVSYSNSFWEWFFVYKNICNMFPQQPCVVENTRKGKVFVYLAKLHSSKLYAHSALSVMQGPLSVRVAFKKGGIVYSTLA